MPTQRDPPNLGPRPGLLCRTPDRLHTFNREIVFLFSGPPRLLPVLRQVGNEDETENRKRQRDNAINDEQPPPARVAIDSVEVFVGGRL